MEEVRTALRQRIGESLNANAGNRLTPELIFGLFQMIDSCLEHFAQGFAIDKKTSPTKGEAESIGNYGGSD